MISDNLKTNILYITLSFFILINLSCDNQGPTSWESPDDPYLYNFDIDINILGNNEGFDFADYNTNDTTRILISLNRSLDDIVYEGAPEKEVYFNWDIEYSSSNLITEDNIIIENGGSTFTDNDGNILLFWEDKGISGDVTLNCYFNDDNGVSWNLDSNENTFIIKSQYEKVNSMHSFSYSDIIVDESFTQSGTIQILVTDGTAPVPFIEVGIVTNNENICTPAVFYFTSNSALTDETGMASFNYLINNINSISDDCTLSYEVSITDDDLNNECNCTIPGNLGITVPSNIQDQNTIYFYQLNMESNIVDINNNNVNTDLDYADNNTEEQTYIEITLLHSEDENDFTNAIPATGKAITFDWDITSNIVTDTPPHLQTLDGTIINQNNYFATDQNGQIKLYWIDSGLATDVTINCNYLDTDGIGWELDNNNSFTITSIYNKIADFDLDLLPGTFIFNDLPAAVFTDTTFTDTITIEAFVRDANGVKIPNIPVNFVNLTPDYGTLIYSVVNTNSNGKSVNILVDIDTEDIPNALDTIEIQATIYNEEGTVIQTDIAVSDIIPQSLFNIYKVSNLDVNYVQNLNLIYSGEDPDTEFTDVIRAQVLDENNTPVAGVKINYDLITDDIGYINSATEYSDSLGFTEIEYHITPADINEIDSEGTYIADTEVIISVPSSIDPESNNEEFEQSLSRVYILQSPPEISQFELDLTPDTLTYNDLPGTDSTLVDEITIEAIVKNTLGVAITNIPVKFINNTPQYGILPSSTIYTDESGKAINYLTDIDTDDITSEIDHIDITAEIYDQSEFGVPTVEVSVNTLATIVPQSLYNIWKVDNIDFSYKADINNIYESSNSNFSDTLIVQVLDAQGTPVKDVPISFSLVTDDVGYISSELEYSNTSGFAEIAFSITPADIEDLANNNNTQLINITATVSDAINAQISRTYDIVPNPEIGYFDLDVTPDTLIYNDLPNSIDSTSTANELMLYAIVKDNAGVAMNQIPVTFTNLSPEYGILSFSTVYTDSLGVASNSLTNIDTENFDYETNTFETINLQVAVIDDDGITLTETESTLIVPKSLENIEKTDFLDTYFSQQLSVINNVTITFADEVVARVKDAQHTPVKNVPINFELVSPNGIGQLSNEIAYSDSSGIATSIFEITPVDMDQFIADFEVININISVGQEFLNTETRTYVLEGSSSIEYEVADLNATLRSSALPTFTGSGNHFQLIAQPVEDNEGYYSINDTLCFSTKDDQGVSVSGVPLKFELFGNAEDQYFGTLSNSLCYTYPDSSYNNNLDSLSCPQPLPLEIGEACVYYEVKDINETLLLDSEATPDQLRALITNPDNQVNNLKNLDFSMEYQTTSALANSIFSFSDPAAILMDVIDSTYCDTIYAVAQNQTIPLKNIPIIFELEAGDEIYGYITNSYAVTDSILYPPYIAATTQFCTLPNLNLGSEAVTIDISTTIQLSDPTLSTNVQIPLSENLPECPDCEESITINSEHFTLPAGENDDIFSTLLTATVVDSTENPAPLGSLVEWQALKADDNGDLSINVGSIDPYTFTDIDGIAETTFNMENDQGLAYIIATAPAFNLADTTFISLSSTAAAYIEIVQPDPSSIEIQGGGGIESTELQVEVRDGNGNLTTDDYLVYFRLGNNSPNGVYFNVEGTEIICVNSSNGLASITLNSGNEPGPISIIAALYELDTDCEDINSSDLSLPDSCSDPAFTDETQCQNNGATWAPGEPITSLQSVPASVVTGPPYSGQINFSYVDIAPISGGLYLLPLSVQIEDIYANPVADSINVYIWVEGHAPHWCSAEDVANTEDFPGLTDEACTFAVEDTIKWGTNEIDSLLYVLTSPILFGQPASSDPGLGLTPGGTNGSNLWDPIPNPAQIVGTAETGMLAPDEVSYPGIAWSDLYYGTSEMFTNVVLKAKTFSANEGTLIIDSRETHSDDPLLLPFQPGVLVAGTAVQYYDFSLSGNPDCGGLDPACIPNPPGEDIVDITITGSITDYYQYPVDDGRMLINAPGATVISVCDPADTDHDGDIGACDDVTIDNCTDCVSAGGIWTPDPDDDPTVGISNGFGQVSWVIEFTESICVPSGPTGGTEIVTYDDWQSDVIVQLLDPLQTTSPNVSITLRKTEFDQ